jgi:uncharacterized protein (TIGR03000 family)
MSFIRLSVIMAVFGLSLAMADATLAQGCTAARGCPTLPTTIPRAAVSSPRLQNAFFDSSESTESVSYEARPTATTTADPVPANKALIRVSVPVEDAVVSFQGVASKAQGKARAFNSPVLAAGRDYRYVVRCVWKDGDRQMVREQRIMVRPGQETAVDFDAGL